MKSLSVEEDTLGTYADWPLARDDVELIQRSTPLEEARRYVLENDTTANNIIVIRSKQYR